MRAGTGATWNGCPTQKAGFGPHFRLYSGISPAVENFSCYYFAYCTHMFSVLVLVCFGVYVGGLLFHR
jgi:hypothetical protein